MGSAEQLEMELDEEVDKLEGESSDLDTGLNDDEVIELSDDKEEEDDDNEGEVLVWLWLWLWLQFDGLSLLFLVCLGDVGCHMINVGTCCPNLHNQSWASSLVVKCVLIVSAKGREFESVKKQMFFCNQIKSI